MKKFLSWLKAIFYITTFCFLVGALSAEAYKRYGVVGLMELAGVPVPVREKRIEVERRVEVMVDPFEVELDETGYKALARKYAETYRVPFSVFWAILGAETRNYDASAVSPVGAMGLGQVMPSNYSLCEDARKPGEKLKNAGLLFDPERNISCAAQLLRRFYEASGKSWFQAVGFYNGGKNGIERCVPNRNGNDIVSYTCTLNAETHTYLRKVFGRIEE